jgi:hypothetical protein
MTNQTSIEGASSILDEKGRTKNASNHLKTDANVKAKPLTKAMLVRGPSATTVTSPENSATFCTRNSAALMSNF